MPAMSHFVWDRQIVQGVDRNQNGGIRQRNRRPDASNIRAMIYIFC